MTKPKPSPSGMTFELHCEKCNKLIFVYSVKANMCRDCYLTDGG